MSDWVISRGHVGSFNGGVGEANEGESDTASEEGGVTVGERVRVTCNTKCD